MGQDRGYLKGLLHRGVFGLQGRVRVPDQEILLDVIVYCLITKRNSDFNDFVELIPFNPEYQS